MSGTTVYAVIGGWNYEGYDDPAGIYSTPEKAQAALKRAEQSKYYDFVSIDEYTIDFGKFEEDDAAAAREGRHE